MIKQSGIGLVILNKIIDPLLSDKKKEGFQKEVKTVEEKLKK